jgi:hypothetical protein
MEVGSSTTGLIELTPANVPGPALGRRPEKSNETVNETATPERRAPKEGHPAFWLVKSGSGGI